MTNSQITIVNNTGYDLSLVHTHFVSFAKTGELHEDINDIFDVKLIEVSKDDFRVIVKFL